MIPIGKGSYLRFKFSNKNKRLAILVGNLKDSVNYVKSYCAGQGDGRVCY
jgi:hypothetical protein